MELNQYDIILIDLNPTIGSEINKTRPCVIISPNELNKFLKTIIIAPMTISPKKYPTRIEINHNSKKGWIAIDQVRTVDKLRVINNLGKMTNSEIKELKSVIHL